MTMTDRHSGGVKQKLRHVAAAVIAVLTIIILWALYDSEFHYPNSDAGRLAAVTAYIPDSDTGQKNSVSKEDPIHVIAWKTVEDRLFIFYGSENRANVHGIVQLVHGINGKYRLVNASMNPFPYTAGIYAESMWVRGADSQFVALAGEGLDAVRSFRVRYAGVEQDQPNAIYADRIYQVEEPDFLLVQEKDALQRELGLTGMDLFSLSAEDIRLYDQAGSDVTAQYEDPSVDRSWSGGKGTAEMGLLYVYMGIVAVFGGILIRYFLISDDRNNKPTGGSL